MADNPKNRLLNFLKANFACVPARRWAIDKESTFIGLPCHLEYAWNYCPDPFWMIWLLHLLSRKIPRVTLDVPTVRSKVAAIMSQLSAKQKFDSSQPCKDAYAILLQYILNPSANPAPDIDKALRLARKAIKDAKGDGQDGGKVTAQSRAAQALAAAVVCWHPRQDDDVPGIIGAAHTAFEFGWEVLDGAKNLPAHRTELANQIRNDDWLGLATPEISAALLQHERTRLSTPPPWSHDTGAPPEIVVFSPVINNPASDSVWWELLGQKDWTTYGTDGGLVIKARTAKVTDGSTVIWGTAIAPTNGNDWGFAFKGLAVGDTVSLLVTLTDDQNVDHPLPNPGLRIA
jgi:hypothetical protein